jgi:biopolymer transport protein ExbB
MNSPSEILSKGGWVMWPLVAFSVVTWAIILERGFVYLVLRPRLRRLAQALLQNVKNGATGAAKQTCEAEKPALAELFLGSIDTNRSKEAAERLTERNRTRMAAHLRRNLWLLATIGSTSPFIGLLGTVLGILRSFNEMAVKGTGGFSVVAGGISESLIATAAGLVVAIFALIAYNAFTSIGNQTMTSLRLALDELLDESFSAQSRPRGGPWP